jgi:hypothetical protein
LSGRSDIAGMLRNDTLCREARAPRRSSHFILFGSALAAALTLSACAGDEAPDEAPQAAEEAAGESIEPPQLTADDIAAALDERRIASLPVGNSGRIDIVNVAATGAPDYVYITVGGSSLTDILQQLVDDQRATPAEVFLALAAADDGLPDALLADHRARAGDDPELSREPRRLSYTALREFDTDINGCPGSLGAWLGGWASRFEWTNYTDNFMSSGQNSSNGSTAYYVSADSEGRVMSACNSGNNDAMVTYWSLTFQPGIYYPYTFVWGNQLGTIEAAHLFSQGSGPQFRMIVSHSHPAPDTYVAYGRCGGGC